MAFQNILDTLSSTVHRDTFSNPLLETQIEPFRRSINQYPYQIPSSALKFFLSNGIAISGFGSKPHPHPIHKTLELNLLNNVWNSFCTSPSTILFMKESKFQKLQRKNPNFSSLINYHLTSRDASRYSTSSSDLPSTSTVYMHDALMYFQPSQIADLFLRCPQLEKLFASAVIPPESHFSTNFSFRPDIYRFNIANDTLHYYLETNQSHSYSQPASAIQWLRTTKIIHPNLTLTVTVLDSYGPLHHILIQRGTPPISPDTDQVSFQTPDCILLPSPNDIQQNISHRLVPSSVYHSLFTYVRAVRTLRITDPAGFVRTQSNKPEFAWVSSSAWDNLQQFAVLTAPYRPINHYFLFRSPLARVTHFLKTHSLHIFKISSLLASASLLSLTYLTSKLFTHKVTHLTLFRRTIVAPNTITNRTVHRLPSLLQKLILPPKPVFKLALSPRPSSLFSYSLPKFISRSLPSNWLSNPAVPTFYKIIAFTVTALPLTAYCYRWLNGPDSPQSIHDQYIRYFHPAPFQMTIPRTPLIINSTEPFLPFESQQPAPEASIPPVTYALPPHEKPNQINVESSTSSSEPPRAQQPIPDLPLPTVNPSPPVSTNPFVDFTNVVPITPSDLSPPEPTPNILQQRSDPNFHPSTEPPPPFAHLPTPEHLPPPTYDAAGTFTFPVAEFPPEPVHHSPLESDPSAAGPKVLFSETVQVPFLNDSGSFFTRRRANWDGPFPAHPIATNCLLTAVSEAMSIPTDHLWNDLCHTLPDSLLNDPLIYSTGLTTDHLAVLAAIHKFSTTIHSDEGSFQVGIVNAPNHFHIRHTSNPAHFSLLPHAPSATITSPKRGASTALLKSLLAFKFNDKPLPFKTIHDYPVHTARAKNLISNMKNGFDGVMATIDPAHPTKAREAILALDLTCDTAPKDRTVKLIHLAGFAGCGKTRPVVNLLKKKDFAQSRVVVPTTELRAEWKDLLHLPPSQAWRISTWESALLKTAPILVIDEVYKMPRGYVDLAITADPTIELVILLGDPLQGEYHSTSQSSTNNRLSSEIQHLLPYIDCYCLWSHRIPQNIAALFQVRSFNQAPGFIHETRQINPKTTVLTCAANTAKTLQQCGYHAITVASSQGSTYPTPVTIHLDRNSNLLSPSHSLVALTRSKAGILFSGDLKILAAPSGNRLFASLAARKPVDLQHEFPDVFKRLPIITEPLANRRFVARGASTTSPSSHVLIPSNLTPSVPIPQVATSSIKQAAHQISQHQHKVLSNPNHAQPVTVATCDPTYHGDVLLSSNVLLGDGSTNQPQVSTHFLPPSRRPLHYDIPSDNPNPVEVSPVFHTPSPHEPIYPGIDFRSMASNFLPAVDPACKEILFRDHFSNQFPFLDRPNELAPQPLSLLAPVHNSKNDPTLLPASIAKRLRFRESDSPYVITPTDTLLGTLLFSALCTAYRRNPNTTIPFQPALFIRCIALNEFAQLTSKTQKVIMANAFRSDPDWRWTAVRIFSKTQHKVNEGSIFGPWKACQTLALMHDALILILGPVKKYQRILDDEDRPDHIYIHAGHTPHELSSWCKNHLSHSTHVANDYTAFDQSQHGEAVVLEVLKMRRVSIPQNLIDLHQHIKTSITTQFGPLTCMRLTGEPGTYDDNTDYNLAVIHLQYHISNQPILVSGDDSLIDSIPPVRSSWETVGPLLNLKFKTELSLYGLFCGYYVGKPGACRSPKALFAKLAVSFDDGSHLEKLPSYITEFSIGHSLGDAMWLLFPVEDVLFQSACFDYFCQFASRTQKVLLRLGEPDPSALSAIADQVKHASYALFSLMSSSARSAFLKLKSKIHFPSNPETDSLQAELLSYSNVSTCLTASNASNQPPIPSLPPPPPRSRSPLRGGLNLAPSLSSPTQPPKNLLLAQLPLPPLSHTQLQPQPTKLTVPSAPQPQSPPTPQDSLTPSSTHPMESALFTLLSSAIPTLLSKSSSSTSNDPLLLADQLHQDPVSLTGSHGALVPTPTPASPIPRPLQTPNPRPARSDLIRSFQWNAYDLTGTETKTTTIDIATKDILQNLAKPYQIAKLVSLEVTLMPTHNAIKYPVTVEVLWAPEDATIGTSHIMDTYSSTRLVAGSLTNPSEHMTLPCDLTLNNPIIKDQIAYNNRPRLYIKFWTNADSIAKGVSAPISASLFIRGRLELVAPAICSTHT